MPFLVDQTPDASLCSASSVGILWSTVADPNRPLQELKLQIIWWKLLDMQALIYSLGSEEAGMLSKVNKYKIQ